MIRLKRHRWKALGLGVVVSAMLLFFALRDMDWVALGETLTHVRPDILALCALMTATGIMLRGARWCLIAGRPFLAVGSFARATNLGVLGNQLLPGRLGEVVRIAALARLLPASASESLSSAMLDRILDICVLLLSAWAVSVVVAENIIPSGWLVSLGGLLISMVVVFALMQTQTFRSKFAAWSERWLQRWGLQPAAFLIVFNAMARRMIRPGSLVFVMTVAGAVWLTDYLVVAAALWSMGLDLPITAPLLLWVLLSAGSALPSTPGYIGIYQIAAVWGLSIYNVPAHQAVATAFVLQLVALSISLIGGGHETTRMLLRTREIINTKTNP